MNFSGEYQLAAPRHKVWAALNDVEVLQESIPGCQELIPSSENEFRAKVYVRLGPVSSNFNLTIKLENVKPPESYTLLVETSSSQLGSGQGETQVSLIEQGEETVLQYTVNFKVRGKLAQVGSRLLLNAIEKLSNDFFSKFSSRFTYEPERVETESKEIRLFELFDAKITAGIIAVIVIIIIGSGVLIYALATG